MAVVVAYWEWQGVKYEAVDPDDWTIRTLKEVEKHLGCTYGEATGADRYLAIAWGVLRHGGSQVTWDGLQDELTGRDVSRLVTSMHEDDDTPNAPVETPGGEDRSPVEVTGTLHITAAPAQPPAREILSPTSADSDS